MGLVDTVDLPKTVKNVFSDRLISGPHFRTPGRPWTALRKWKFKKPFKHFLFEKINLSSKVNPGREMQYDCSASATAGRRHATRNTQESTNVGKRRRMGAGAGLESGESRGCVAQACHFTNPRGGWDPHTPKSLREPPTGDRLLPTQGVH